MNFEWDPAKNRANIAQHGISFEAAVWVFQDPNQLEMPDDIHSGSGEARYQMYGCLPNGQVYMVVFTETEGGGIRIITAYTSKKIEEIYYGD